MQTPLPSTLNLKLYIYIKTLIYYSTEANVDIQRKIQQTENKRINTPDIDKHK